SPGEQREQEDGERSYPHERDTSLGCEDVRLEEALERVAPDAEADHAAGVVDGLDHLRRHHAPAAGEEAGPNGEGVRHVRSGAVHRALDPADGPTLIVGDEKTIQ